MSACSTPGGCGPSTTVCGTGGWTGPKPGDPDNNIVLTAVPGNGGIALYWTMPSVNPHAVAHFRIFRGISNNLDNATLLAVVSADRYFDANAGLLIREYFYWVQIVTINGTVFNHIGPASATALPTLDQLLQSLTQRIEDGMLAQTLRARIDKIVDLEAGLTILNNLVVTENGVFNQELIAIRNDITNAVGYIDEQNNIRISEQQALVSSVNTLVAQTSNDLNASIQQELRVLADDIGDLQGQFTLKIDLAGYVSGFGLSSKVDPAGNKTSDFGVLASTFFIGPPSMVQPTAPDNPFHGKVWVDTSVNPTVTRWFNASSNQWENAPIKGSVPFVVKTEPEVTPDGFTIPPGIYMDTAFISRLSADKIDTRGLTIRDEFGNIILGSGTGLDWNLVQGVNKPQDGATRVVFRGDWTTLTVYQVGDTVLFNGSGWAAREQHTSSGSNQPPSSGNQNTWWNAFAVKGNDGESALTTIVPNESHTLPASFDGVVSSYAGSGTTIQVFEGATALNAVSTLSANGQFTVGVPTQSPVSTLTVGSRTFSGTTATVAQHEGMVSGTDTVIITYPITARTSTGNVISYSVTQTLTKSKAGATGASAKAAFLIASSQVFQVAKSGTPSPSSITLTASGQNVTGLPTFTVTSGTATLTGTGSTRTLTYANMATDTATVQITWDGQTDTITLVKVREGLDGVNGTNGIDGANGADGLNGLTVVVSNEAHTLPASSAGVVSSYTGSGTTIQVYEGSTLLSAVSSISGNSQFTIGTPTQDPASTITVGGRSYAGNTATVTNHSAMVNGTNAVVVTYPISIRRANGSNVTINRAQTLTKSLAGASGAQGPAGATGAQGPAVVVTANRALSFTSTDGNLDGSQDNIVLTAAVSGISSPTYAWTFSGLQTNPTASTTNTQTITSAQFGTSNSATVTCTVNGAFVDQVTIVRLNRSTAAAGATVGANSNNLTVGVGANLIYNGNFADGLAGTTVGWRNDGPAHTLGINLSDAYRVRGEGTAFIHQAGVAPVNTVFDANVHGGPNQQTIAVIPGRRYEFYAWLNTHRCTAHVIILWLNSAGAQVGASGANSVSFGSEVRSLADMRISHGFATAPIEAVQAIILVRAVTNGQADPYVFFSRCYLGEAGAGQTEVSPWTPGRGISQITPANASTYIANAAITDAQIGNLSANKIVASTLSTITANAGTITAGVLSSADNKFVIDLNNKTIRIEV